MTRVWSVDQKIKILLCSFEDNKFMIGGSENQNFVLLLWRWHEYDRWIRKWNWICSGRELWSVFLMSTDGECWYVVKIFLLCFASACPGQTLPSSLCFSHAFAVGSSKWNMKLVSLSSCFTTLKYAVCSISILAKMQASFRQKLFRETRYRFKLWPTPRSAGGTEGGGRAQLLKHHLRWVRTHPLPFPGS